MIYLDENLHLEPVKLSDHRLLFKIMQEIYPPVYSHMWFDKGAGFLKQLYSESNLGSELENPDSRYYFVKFDKGEVGILRFILNEPLPGEKNDSMVKLHRIYLLPKLHGQGIGRKIIKWIEAKYCRGQNVTLWLEVMETQRQAIGFYEKLGFVRKEKVEFNWPGIKDTYSGMYRMAKAF